jgi:hypothetical protein
VAARYRRGDTALFDCRLSNERGMTSPLVRMSILGVIPRLSDGWVCPYCGEVPVEMLVAWSTVDSPVEVEMGAYCPGECDAMFFEGPTD